MSKWSKLPPRKPCTAHFRGVRRSSNNQGMRVDEVVQVIYTFRGQAQELAVAMFGKQTIFRLERFEGEWLIYPDANALADIHRTLLGALKIEVEEYGESAETINARLWLEGKLKGAVNVR